MKKFLLVIPIVLIILHILNQADAGPLVWTQDLTGSAIWQHGIAINPTNQQIMYAALAALRLTDLEALEEVGEGRSRGHLQRLTAKLAGFLRELSDVITHKHLTHTAASRQLSATFAVPAI